MKAYLKFFTVLFCTSVVFFSCKDTNTADSREETTMQKDTIISAHNETNVSRSLEDDLDRDGDGTLEEADGQTAADRLNMDADANVKVKEDKIKMEDSEKKVKIKTDKDDGSVEKAKVKFKDEEGN